MWKGDISFFGHIKSWYLIVYISILTYLTSTTVFFVPPNNPRMHCDLFWENANGHGAIYNGRQNDYGRADRYEMRPVANWDKCSGLINRQHQIHMFRRIYRTFSVAQRFSHITACFTNCKEKNKVWKLYFFKTTLFMISKQEMVTWFLQSPPFSRKVKLYFQKQHSIEWLSDHGYFTMMHRPAQQFVYLVMLCKYFHVCRL